MLSERRCRFKAPMNERHEPHVVEQREATKTLYAGPPAVIIPEPPPTDQLANKL